jgi:lysophospholipase L1-like esterase
VRPPSVRVLPALALVTFGLLCGPLVAAAPAAPAAYVALGDSYTAGLGTTKFIASSGACKRSRQSYAYLLGRKLSAFRACAGATTEDVLDDQLEPFPGVTKLVTITIGGNDAGFADVISTCLFGDANICKSRVDSAARFIRDKLPARLRRTYAAIRKRAPKATVVVVGYPRLFAGKPCSGAGKIDAASQRRLNTGSDLLSRTIATEVKRHARFRFADVRDAFEGHGLCSASSRIAGINSGTILNAFHPNPAGYLAYARVIEKRLR